MKELTIYFQPNTQDYVKGFRAYHWQKPWLITIGTIMAITCFIAIVSLITTFLFGIQAMNPLIAIYLLILGALLSAVFVYPISLVRTVNKSAMLNSEARYHFRRNGTIEYKTSNGETVFEKNHFDEAILGKEHIVLIHRNNRRMFQVLPRRAFESAEMEIGLRDWLQFNTTEFRIN